MTALVTKETEVHSRKNQNLKIDPRLDLSPVEVLKIASIVVPVTSVDNTLHMGKLVNLVAERTILPKSVSQSVQSQSSGSAKPKSFKYREVNLDQEYSDDNGQIDEITSKVRSMYYHDVHFKSVNTRMHINLNMRSCNGNSMKTHFKMIHVPMATYLH